jgi:hypothetical protein
MPQEPGNDRGYRYYKLKLVCLLGKIRFQHPDFLPINTLFGSKEDRKGLYETFAVAGSQQLPD